MSLTIKLNGLDYTNWETAEVFRSMEMLCGSFSFTSSADENNLFPIKVGSIVDITADGISVLKGYVEKIRINWSIDSHSITVSGRSRLCDLLDSTVGETKEFVGSIWLFDVIRKVLNDIGLNDVEIKDETGGYDIFQGTDIVSAEPGLKAFDFLEKYARKKQILLTNDGKGNLVLARASKEVFPAVLKNKVDGNDNNILSATHNIDTSNRYNKYIVHSQLNTQNQDEGVKPKDIASQKGQAIDGEIRTSRILEINAEESSDSQTAIERAKWEANFRRAQSKQYKPTVQGHSVNGQVWKPNVLVEVQDDFSDVQATLLVSSVRYTQSIEGGSTTVLGVVAKDAYTLQAEQDARDAVTNKQGSGFTA